MNVSEALEYLLSRDDKDINDEGTRLNARLVDIELSVSVTGNRIKSLCNSIPQDRSNQINTLSCLAKEQARLTEIRANLEDIHNRIMITTNYYKIKQNSM